MSEIRGDTVEEGKHLLELATSEGVPLRDVSPAAA
jgi:hypothetical protein